MNITGVTSGAFASGFYYFCPSCGVFFSARFNTDCTVGVEYCPCCGESDLISTTSELLEHCAAHHTDPVNFYSAFPSDEPIPLSRTGATPRQVGWIVGCVVSDKKNKRPVTTESLAAALGYDKEIVRTVFEELHLSESGGTA